MNSETVALFYSRAIKESILQSGEKVERGNGHERKRAAAITWLGRRYVLHKSNRIKKLEIVEEVRRGKR